MEWRRRSSKESNLSPPAGRDNWYRGTTTGSRASFFGLLALLATLGGFLIAFFRGFLPGPGPLVYGNLGATYTYSGVQPHWLLTLALYLLANQAFSLTVSWSIVQNVVYVSAFLLPAIGVYFFLEPFTRSKPLAALTAIATGTIINPILGNMFVGGDPHYELWIFFFLLGCRFLLSALYSVPRRAWSGVLAGIFLGLASTQAYANGSTGSEALVLGAPILLAFIVHALARSWRQPRLRQVSLDVATFLAAYAILLIPTIFADLGTASSVFSSGSQTQTVASYNVGTAIFTFRSFGFLPAVLATPPAFSQNSWAAVINPVWAVIVATGLVAGAYNVFFARGTWRWMNAIFFFAFLAYTAFIVEVQSGTLLSIYAWFPPLGILERPPPLVFAQLTCVPFLFLSFLLLLTGEVPRATDVPAAPQTYGPLHIPSLFTECRRFQRVAWMRRLGRAPLAEAVALVLVVALLVSSLPISDNLEALVEKNSGGNGTSPFVPSSLFAVREWYANANPAVTGYVLPLPSNSLAAVGGFIPVSQLWVPPYLGQQLHPGYSPTSYVTIMDTLANGSVDAWATLIGFAGVQYVVVYANTTAITLAPSYLTGKAVTVPYARLTTELANCSDLQLAFDSSGVLVYQDRLFSSPGTSNAHVSTFVSAPTPTSPSEGPELPQDGFSGWSASGVSLTLYSNGSARLSMNSTQSKATLYASLATVRLREANGTNVGFDPTYNPVQIHIQDKFTIPTGLSLQTYVAWYNLTPSSSQFFDWFATTPLGGPPATHPAGTTGFSATLIPPAGTVFGRVIFTAFNLRGQAGSLYLATPTSQWVVATSTVSGSAAAQLRAANDLVAQSAFPATTTQILSPLAEGLTPELPEGAWGTSIIPAAFADPAGSRNFSVPLTPVAFPVLSDSGTLNSTALLVSGTSHSASFGASISLTLGPNSQSLAVPKGSFGAAFDLPTSSVGLAVALSLRGNLTLGFLGLTVRTSLPAGTVALFSVALPIGIRTGAISPESLRLAGVTAPVLLSSPNVLPTDFVPLPGLAILIGLVAWTNHRRRSRAARPSESLEHSRHAKGSL